MDEGYAMIGIRPEEYTDGSGLDITQNMRDMESKFRYTTLDDMHRER